MTADIEALELKKRLELEADERNVGEMRHQQLKRVDAEVAAKKKAITDELKKSHEDYISIKTQGEVFDFLRAQEDKWRETTEEQAESNRAHREYLAATDWYFARLLETGKPIPEAIKEKRALARDSIEHGDYVYAQAELLRSAHYPSLEERYQAYKEGGYKLLEIRKKMAEVNLKFPLPR